MAAEINPSTSLRINGERSRTIKNLKRVAERILEAIKNKEKIILYGDADLDGVASVIILEETIKTLGGKVQAVYFPDREIEGYGLSEVGLNFLKERTPALLITLDCGISNFPEAKLAKKLGFELIIIDHHEILDKLPEAKIIVDPKQKGDRYPFKNLASAGVVFKLSELLLGEKMAENLRKTFLELVTLATLADMMPKENDNQLFIGEGLSSITHSWRPGIRSFLETEPIKDFPNLNQKVAKIISILNIRDVKERLPASFRLLTSSSMEEAEKIIQELISKSQMRRERIEEIVQEVEKRIEGKDNLIIFEGDESFELTLLSSAASIICQKYQKPTFLFKKMVKETQGTVRVPAGLDSVSLMKKCKDFPLTFGGHPPASGFRIKNENLEKFKECLIKNL